MSSLRFLFSETQFFICLLKIKYIIIAEEKEMREKLDALLKEGTARIEAAQTEAELQEVKGALLGKQGSITELLKEIPKLDVALRPEMGKAVNNVKSLLTEQIEGRREAIKLKASEIPADFDCTIPGFEPKIGGLHPIT